ncbi:MAG: exonuclease SbcCD subunit D [Paeniclostridium sordellii]|uniref:Nuclease SbcCD subunit D n=1 Tax=Paeniclostridium hominis TaxID=2764329 RepID=A0ABR7JZE2_9FIRM|nr:MULTISPECIES: exonuclease SbcCD subunit D [Paeniclostridium]MBC6002178.1 exonuclease SbcCD subunit D [Paeniclostridium hominis]MDU2592250.1 exonuclease SbcCD subunit D [Paeniclostridium sordellii]
MRFIHTSDWHLGKNLEGHSRLAEQEKFCKDFIDLVNENDIDMVIIAGDIYDTSNPPAQAEKLFYKTVSELSQSGKRCVLIIAGNHDNPERLSAASPLAHEQGIIILGMPNSYTQPYKYNGFEIVFSEEGVVELKIKDESVVISTLPYPSEKRLNEVLVKSTDDKDKQQTYTEKIGEIFKLTTKRFKEDTINIAVSHLFVLGGETTDSERPIELGGSLIVNTKDLPQNAQYIALGHLHKPQKVSERLNAYYSGSPLQYSKDERSYSKGANIVDIKAGEKPKINQIYFKNYKPIEVFKCSGIEEALKICEENKDRDIWSYFEIKTEEVLAQSDIKKMKDTLKDIIEIRPIITSNEQEEVIDMKEKSMGELFKEFYSFSRGVEPKGELMDLFLDIVSEEGEDINEAN